ncbi:hypothetical protein [Nguyenibacter vanlangensis]|uniref:Uncharacterized protein n=1 Tax=Nguyenibacter vanlangensis TaxID=1216886 RepID=A0A7Y7ITA0_9PROT|nr:hypothetical protein [Nguyenibacter vanlangensis]NVN09747.1 hypothetical protein [Nguyenibacter vanlangensis]
MKTAIHGRALPPESIDWSAVKCLWVQDALDEINAPTVFFPCVVFMDDTWSCLALTTDITSARQCVACLGALYDKPVKDWTRPAPETLAEDSFFYSMRDLLPENHGREIPEQEPQWGAGWSETDHLFRDGATGAEFMHELAEMDRIFREGIVEEDLDRARVSMALRATRETAVRRWIMLHVANPRHEATP